MPKAARAGASSENCGITVNYKSGSATPQSRALSLVEAVTNVVVGYAIAVLAQIVVLPHFGVRLSLGENLLLGMVFTVVSLVRSYLLRRLFEARRTKY
jgi:hypothetical protein